MNDPDLLTGDVARLLEVSAQRVRQLERAGLLAARRTARGWRIYRAADVEAHRAQRQREHRGR